MILYIHREQLSSQNLANMDTITKEWTSISKIKSFNHQARLRFSGGFHITQKRKEIEQFDLEQKERESKLDGSVEALTYEKQMQEFLKSDRDKLVKELNKLENELKQFKTLKK